MAVSLRSAVLALLMAGVLAVPARAQHPSSDSTDVLRLDALLREVRENPSLRAARLNAQALAQRPAQEEALPDPMVGLVYQPVPVVTARGWQRTQWRAEQSVPYPGKRALRADVARLGAEVADLDADALALDLARDVRAAYYRLYRIQEQQHLLDAFQAQLRDFEQSAATRYEVGTGSQQSILKAQLERNRLTERAMRLAEERRTALETLARLLDRPAEALPQGDVVVAPPPVPEADTLLEAAYVRRPELQMLRTAEERAERQVELAQKQFYPDFTFSVTYFDIADTDVPPSADGRDALAIGAGVKVPLWRGRLRANLEEARLQRESAEARSEALETAIRTQLGDLVTQLQTQERQLDLYRETLVPQAQTTLEATLSAYSAGRASFLDLLDAERSLFQLRMDQVTTQARYLDTSAALDRAVGTPLR